MALRTGCISAVLIVAFALAMHQLNAPLVPFLAMSFLGTSLLYASLSLFVVVQRVTPMWISVTPNGLFMQTLLGTQPLPFSRMVAIEVVGAQSQPLIHVVGSPRAGKPGRRRTYAIAPEVPVEDLVGLLQLHAPLSHCDVLVHDDTSS